MSNMNFLRLLPVVLSLLVLGAHFFRAGSMLLVFACLAAILLLPLRRSWVARLTQVILLLGALEWLRTLFSRVQMRLAMDGPWLRLALILGIVTTVTLVSALTFHRPALRRRYHLD